METLAVVAIVTILAMFAWRKQAEEGAAVEHLNEQMRQSGQNPDDIEGCCAGGCIRMILAFGIFMAVIFYITAGATATGLDDEWLALLRALAQPLEDANRALGKGG